MIARFYQILHISGGILVKIMEPFSATASLGFYRTFKGMNKTKVVHRISVKNEDARLTEFGFILIESKQFNKLTPVGPVGQSPEFWNNNYCISLLSTASVPILHQAYSEYVICQFVGLILWTAVKPWIVMTAKLICLFSEVEALLKPWSLKFG